MGSSFPVRKRRKHLHDCVDQISGLPDEVVSHIFSFLSTKDVVRTSILSKRWEHVWTLGPNLDFDDQFVCDAVDYKCKFRDFKDFVDGVLFHHRSNIKRCYLGCFTKYSYLHMYSWIYVVLRCNVQDIIIKSTFPKVKEWPWGLFTFKTLVSLQITGRFVINLPYYICFPNLKKLHLDSVVYVDDYSMGRLFSSCLVLEELYLRRKPGDCVLIANILVPRVKRLSLFYVPVLEPIVRVGIAGHDYKTNINAPHLEYFKVNDLALKDYSVNFSKSLVEAHILDRCSVLLEEISNVQCLELSGKAMEGLLQSKGSCYKFYIFYWTPPDRLPDCLLLNLKLIEVHKFAGRKRENFLLRYMLEHAEVLEEMKIHWYTRSESVCCCLLKECQSN